MDEATSSIDTLSEKLIQKATKKITENRTSIIIAHRLSTIINSDNIIVMSNGKLIEMGKIHKIESKNAFVACRSSDCEISKATAFSICESCEMVDEISDAKLSKYISSFNHKKGMKFKRFNLEFFGLCKKCK